MVLVSSIIAALDGVGQKAPSTSIDVSIWKWVIVIGVVAVIIFYGIKRISDIVVKKKTDTMIREVADEKENDKDDQ